MVDEALFLRRLGLGVAVLVTPWAGWFVPLVRSETQEDVLLAVATALPLLALAFIAGGSLRSRPGLKVPMGPWMAVTLSGLLVSVCLGSGVAVFVGSTLFVLDTVFLVWAVSMGVAADLTRVRHGWYSAFRWPVWIGSVVVATGIAAAGTGAHALAYVPLVLAHLASPAIFRFRPASPAVGDRSEAA